MSEYSDHNGCFTEETCLVGNPLHCPGVAACERRAAAKSGAWNELLVRKDSGGLRHYLNGEPVHCGARLELQAVEIRTDEYGEYSAFVQRGRGVRYEATFKTDKIAASLHANVDGHEFIAPVEAWMRFRWPG